MRLRKWMAVVKVRKKTRSTLTMGRSSIKLQDNNVLRGFRLMVEQLIPIKQEMNQVDKQMDLKIIPMHIIITNHIFSSNPSHHIVMQVAHHNSLTQIHFHLGAATQGQIATDSNSTSMATIHLSMDSQLMGVQCLLVWILTIWTTCLANYLAWWVTLETYLQIFKWTLWGILLLSNHNFRILDMVANMLIIINHRISNNKNNIMRKRKIWMKTVCHVYHLKK